MDTQDKKRVLEALLFITETPVPLKALQTLWEEPVSKDDLTTWLHELAAEYRDKQSAIEIREIAGGWQMSTRSEYAPWIRKLFKDRLTYRLSSSALETLSIIAYKQPITRQDIEDIRGVEVSGVLDTLLDRRLIKIVGRKEVIGRPLLYGTTTDFLKAFNLKALDDLPSVESLVPPPAAGGPFAERAPEEAAEPEAALIGAAAAPRAPDGAGEGEDLPNE